MSEWLKYEKMHHVPETMESPILETPYLKSPEYRLNGSENVC